MLICWVKIGLDDPSVAPARKPVMKKPGAKKRCQRGLGSSSRCSLDIAADVAFTKCSLLMPTKNDLEGPVRPKGWAGDSWMAYLSVFNAVYIDKERP